MSSVSRVLPGSVVSPTDGASRPARAVGSTFGLSRISDHPAKAAKPAKTTTGTSINGENLATAFMLLKRAAGSGIGQHGLDDKCGQQHEAGTIGGQHSRGVFAKFGHVRFSLASSAASRRRRISVRVRISKSARNSRKNPAMVR